MDVAINRRQNITHSSIFTTTLKHLRRRVARLQNSNPYSKPNTIASSLITSRTRAAKGLANSMVVLAVIPQRKAAVHAVKRRLHASTSSRATTSDLPSSFDFPLPLYTSPIRKARHYLFGYGSLINPQSRLRTVSTPTTAIPALVRGFQRAWSYNCSHTKSTYTAVGVTRVPDSTAVTNGVLVPLERPEVELPMLDMRERHYVRELVTVRDVQLWKGSSTLGDAHEVYVWIYTNSSSSHSTTTTRTQPLTQTPHIPCCNSPIPQSYIDCIIAGCLMYGAEFTRQFINSTIGWDSGVWLNDRHADESVRKYVRNVACGEVDVVDPEVVDGVLKEIIPEALKGRVEA
ncbi:hypothetical protein HK097_011268 [Rhizophlyctis rosea]|uniref:glutathione-specific gamma-glutamylcyclotransferase n=1 Tax=Rhizophlyctis rosea TaxID=64517 RepID=A0AAD5SHP5_9FUNG|nr:hypothetical protein HK097_011268 [Rhizophlyctis rosea]